MFNNWFGLDNQLSKAMIAAALCFFPVMINTVRGLTLVDPAAVELLRSLAASETQVFRKLRVPNALPYIFTALRLAATLATLFAHQLQPRYQYQHRWTEGDVLVWDHIGTLHYAIPDYGPDEPRLMKRCQVIADRVFDPAFLRTAGVA